MLIRANPRSFQVAAAGCVAVSAVPEQASIYLVVHRTESLNYLSIVYEISYLPYVVLGSAMTTRVYWNAQQLCR